jgi:hypothetical protein
MTATANQVCRGLAYQLQECLHETHRFRHCRFADRRKCLRCHYGAAQPTPVDFNNGELATYPAQVHAFEPQQQAAANTQIIISAAEENVGELAAYPLVPVNVTQLSRTDVRSNARVSTRSNAWAES